MHMCSVAMSDRNKHCIPFHLEEEKQDSQAEAEDAKEGEKTRAARCISAFFHSCDSPFFVFEWLHGSK